MIGFAPELDGRFAKLYTYLQNDLIKKQPSAEMLLDLFCACLEEKLEAREYFSPSAPLLSKFVKLDEKVAAFLQNSDETDPKITRFSTLVKSFRSFDDLIVPDEHKNCLLEAVKRTIKEDSRLMFFFYGPSGTGKKLAAEACCREIGVNLLLADYRVFLKGGEESLYHDFAEALSRGISFPSNLD